MWTRIEDRGGSRERAKAQRAKLDAQAETQYLQEEREAVVQATQHKKTGRQEIQAKRRPGEDHLFLSEMRKPLTKNGVEMLFKRLKERAGIIGKRVSPHILRHTFAINYLVKSNDPFSLQELLGYEDMTAVKLYMHMNDAIIHVQKRKYSLGDHFSFQAQGQKTIRRTGFKPKTRGKRAGG